MNPLFSEAVTEEAANMRAEYKWPLFWKSFFSVLLTLLVPGVALFFVFYILNESTDFICFFQTNVDILNLLASVTLAIFMQYIWDGVRDRPRKWLQRAALVFTVAAYVLWSIISALKQFHPDHRIVSSDLSVFNFVFSVGVAILTLAASFLYARYNGKEY